MSIHLISKILIQHLSFKALSFRDISVNVCIFRERVKRTASSSPQRDVLGLLAYSVLNQSSLSSLSE